MSSRFAYPAESKDCQIMNREWKIIFAKLPLLKKLLWLETRLKWIRRTNLVFAWMPRRSTPALCHENSPQSLKRIHDRAVPKLAQLKYFTAYPKRLLKSSVLFDYPLLRLKQVITPLANWPRALYNLNIAGSWVEVSLTCSVTSSPHKQVRARADQEGGSSENAILQPQVIWTLSW